MELLATRALRFNEPATANHLKILFIIMSSIIIVCCNNYRSFFLSKGFIVYNYIIMGTQRHNYKLLQYSIYQL